MPRIADLFCAAGGAARGYHDAGWEVVGVDLRHQPEYPYEFHRGDALAFDLAGFDAVHASPPCQWATGHVRADTRLRLFSPHPNLVPATRARLAGSGLPYVIENVPAAGLVDPIRLCGSSFGLGVIRHRCFELGRWTPADPPPPCAGCRGAIAARRAITVTGHGGGLGTGRTHTPGGGGDRVHRFPGESIVASFQRALGVSHITAVDRLAEAIPPAYTEWIGRQLLAAVHPPVQPVT